MMLRTALAMALLLGTALCSPASSGADEVQANPAAARGTDLAPTTVAAEVYGIDCGL